MRLTHDQAATEMRSAGLMPLDPYKGVDSPWRSRCLRCSREITPTLSNVRAGKRCKYCNGREVDPDEAAAEMRAAGLEPLTPYPGANEPWKCRCTECGFEPTPTLVSVRKGHRCRKCAGQVLDPAEAAQVMLAAGLIPLVPYPGADAPWPCHCPICGNDPSPSLSSIRAGCGCLYCCTPRYDYGAPAIVYVMTHPLGSVKIGICGDNERNMRLVSHKRHGWKPYQQLHLPTGELAHQVEQAVLKRLRGEYRLIPYMTAETMPQGGWTETFNAKIMPAKTLWKMVQDQANEILDNAMKN